MTASEPIEKEFDIRISSDGTWYHEGGEIKRQALVRLFASVLSCDEQGQHWLRTPVEYGRVEVEDVAFIITEMDTATSSCGQQITMRDNLGRDYDVGSKYALYLKPDKAGSVRPYLSLDNGLSARLAHPVYYQLAELAEPDDKTGQLGVISNQIFFSLEQD